MGSKERAGKKESRSVFFYFFFFLLWTMRTVQKTTKTTNTSHHFKNVTITMTEWRSFLFSLLWDVWRASHRMFTKHFNPSQYQSTTRNNICRALPQSAFTGSQRFLAACLEVYIFRSAIAMIPRSSQKF